MRFEQALRRAQVYRFLADACLYPVENWSEDLPVLQGILASLDTPGFDLRIPEMDLEDLQAAHRRAFGVNGSLCYETEYGLPHEYRQSQELADLAGFYAAFGFQMGGPVRERPDHLAVELEFMHVLAFKEAIALQDGLVEHVEICVDAQRKFLGEHLGVWISLMADSLARHAGDNPFTRLVRATADFVQADADRLDARPAVLQRSNAHPTPFDPDFTCQGCPVAEGENTTSGGLA